MHQRHGIRGSIAAILALCALAGLTGCGSDRPVSHVQWQDDHPYAERIGAITAPPGTGMLSLYTYHDLVPDVQFGQLGHPETNRHTVTPTTFTIAVNDRGDVVAEERMIGQVGK